MSKRKAKRLPHDEKSERKRIVARHLKCTAYSNFEIVALRPDGTERLIGEVSFNEVNLEIVTAMLNQLAQLLGDCEIKWGSFADVTEENMLQWEPRDA